jgi:Fic family protein
LKEPLLYLSLYFKTHRRRYYELLGGVRRLGDWEGWLDFFAEAVIAIANQAIDTAQRLSELLAEDIGMIYTLLRASDSAMQIHVALRERPIVTANWLVKKTRLTPATVNPKETQPAVQLCPLYRNLKSRNRRAGMNAIGCHQMRNHQ